MDFGSTLKAAREAKNLTISQVAAKTHILAQTIEGLERNDFKMIPAPIYGRGFVKLIAEYLEADALLLMELFKAAYFNRPAQIPQTEAAAPANRAVSPAAAAEKEIRPSAVRQAQQEQTARISLQKAPEEVVRPVPETPAAAPVSPQPQQSETRSSRFAAPVQGEDEDLFNQAQSPSLSYSKAPSRFAAPLPEDNDEADSQGVFTYVAEGFSYGVEHAKRRIKRVPSSFWRMAVLALCSIVIVYFIIAGLVRIFGISKNQIPEVAGPVGKPAAAGDNSNVPTLDDAVKGKVAPDVKPDKPKRTDGSTAALPEPIYFN